MWEISIRLRHPNRGNVSYLRVEITQPNQVQNPIEFY